MSAIDNEPQHSLECEPFALIPHRIRRKETGLYICNCNAITEREVSEAIDAGATYWKDVHAHYDREPCCGKCECQISEAIDQAAQVAKPRQLKTIQSCRPVQTSVDRAA